MPRSWVKPSGNILVLFEEMGGDPTQIGFATRQIGSLCSHVSESHPQPVDMWDSDQKTGRKSGPVLLLECPSPDQVISSIKFASFGTPSGTCGSFTHGQCSSTRALSIVQKVHSIKLFYKQIFVGFTYIMVRDLVIASFQSKHPPLWLIILKNVQATYFQTGFL